MRCGEAICHSTVMGQLSRTALRRCWEQEPNAEIYIDEGMAVHHKFHVNRRQVYVESVGTKVPELRKCNVCVGNASKG